MLVKLLVARAGPGIAQNRGDEVDVDEAEAIRMIEADQAIPVRAAFAATEKAVRAKARKGATEMAV